MRLPFRTLLITALSLNRTMMTPPRPLLPGYRSRILCSRTSSERVKMMIVPKYTLPAVMAAVRTGLGPAWAWPAAVSVTTALMFPPELAAICRPLWLGEMFPGTLVVRLASPFCWVACSSILSIVCEITTLPEERAVHPIVNSLPVGVGLLVHCTRRVNGES